MYVEKCVYMDGFHVYPDSGCVHTRSTDEQGPVQQTGWTVQTGQTSNPPLERQHSGYSNEE